MLVLYEHGDGVLKFCVYVYTASSKAWCTCLWANSFYSHYLTLKQTYPQAVSKVSGTTSENSISQHRLTVYLHIFSGWPLLLPIYHDTISPTLTWRQLDVTLYSWLDVGILSQFDICKRTLVRHNFVQQANNVTNTSWHCWPNVSWYTGSAGCKQADVSPM